MDANVLALSFVGAPLGLPTPPAQIWRRWEEESFDLLLSSHVFDELNRTLDQPWFIARITPSIRNLFTHRLQTLAKNVSDDADVSGIASHWQDDLVLSAAVSGNADFLVTRDKAFRKVDEYRGVKVRTPEEFLQVFDHPTS